MRVIYGIGKVEKTLKDVVLAIGVFDGLHLGHQRLINAAVKKAKLIGGTAVVMTFSPHPVQVLHPSKALPFIISLPYRLKLIEQLGVNACIVTRFTKKFSQLTAKKFIQKYLVGHVLPKEVFVGEDFRFGQDRQGTLGFFKEVGRQYGFNVNTVPPVKAGGKKIGSSRIRHLISQGKLSIAKRYLGRDVAVMGDVIKGDGRGNKLGFPTVNIDPLNEVILPLGVYAVRVIIDGQRLNGMANVGRRPSFKKKNERINIEAHIFDFKKNVYGKEIIIEFIKKIRKERFFDAPSKMISQLKRDETKSRVLLQCA